MELISGNTTLPNQRLDNLIKEIANLKGSLQFTQQETEGKLNKLNEETSRMEINLFSLKKDIELIQTNKPRWATEIENKLVDLETVPGGTI